MHFVQIFLLYRRISTGKGLLQSKKHVAFSNVMNYTISVFGWSPLLCSVIMYYNETSYVNIVRRNKVFSDEDTWSLVCQQVAAWQKERPGKDGI